MSTQAVIDQINNLTDDGVELIDNIINSLNPKYFVIQPDEKKRDVSRRIGAGKGVIGNTDHFDDDNEEISALFYLRVGVRYCEQNMNHLGACHREYIL